MKPKKYPSWICNDCGTTYGNWYKRGTYTGPEKWLPTYHIGNCDICSSLNIPVTEPRDFGGLKRPITYIKPKN